MTEYEFQSFLKELHDLNSTLKEISNTLREIKDTPQPMYKADNPYKLPIGY